MNIIDLISADRRYTSTTADLHHWREAYPHLQETASGERVTIAAALGISAFFACVRNISEDEAKLPFHVFRRMGRNRMPVPDHEVDYLLNTEPNPEMTAMAFREAITAHAVGLGNGYAEIIRDGMLRPIALWPMNPATIKAERRDGELFYVQRLPNEERRLPAHNVLHIHGLAFDGISGYSIINIAREALGAAIAAQKFGASFFANGMSVGGVLSHPETVSDGAMKRLRKSVEDRHIGKAGSLMIIEEAMSYEQLAVDPEKGQMVEMNQYFVETVARFFRMPLHKIGHLLRATNNNIEHQGLEYVTDTMIPWEVRWEQEVRKKLFTPAERNLVARHNNNALLRGDTTSRGAWYSKMLMEGVYSVNDVRALEDLNPIPNGDTHYHQMNMIELGKEPPEPAPAPALPPTVPGAGGDDEEDDEGNRALMVCKAHSGALADAYRRILRIEEDKVRRAHRRGDLETWAPDFYAGHGAHVRAVLSPIVETACATMALVGMAEPRPVNVLAHVVGMARRHIAASQADMGPDALTDWLGARAERQAEDEARRLVEIISELPTTETTDA